MSARILTFSAAPAQLQLKGYTLIAWRQGAERWDEPDEAQWLHGIWKPATGKGWYRSGYFVPAWSYGHFHSHMQDSRICRKGALAMWRWDKMREPYRWHYLQTEAQAFPEKRRQYVRPPRLRVPSMA